MSQDLDFTGAGAGADAGFDDSGFFDLEGAFQGGNPLLDFTAFENSADPTPFAGLQEGVQNGWENGVDDVNAFFNQAFEANFEQAYGFNGGIRSVSPPPAALQPNVEQHFQFNNINSTPSPPPVALQPNVEQPLQLNGTPSPPTVAFEPNLLEQLLEFNNAIGAASPPHPAALEPNLEQPFEFNGAASPPTALEPHLERSPQFNDAIGTAPPLARDALEPNLLDQHFEFNNAIGTASPSHSATLERSLEPSLEQFPQFNNAIGAVSPPPAVALEPNLQQFLGFNNAISTAPPPPPATLEPNLEQPFQFDDTVGISSSPSPAASSVCSEANSGGSAAGFLNTLNDAGVAMLQAQLNNAPGPSSTSNYTPNPVVICYEPESPPDSQSLYPRLTRSRFRTSAEAKAHRKRARIPPKSQASDVDRVKNFGRDYWVCRIFNAMTYSQNVTDSQSSIHRKRFTTHVAFEAVDLEAAAHHVFDEAIAVHERGWCRPTVYHKNTVRGKLVDISGASLEMRLSRICVVLQQTKSAVDDALRGGVTLALLCDNPEARNHTKVSNNAGNAKRGERLKQTVSKERAEKAKQAQQDTEGEGEQQLGNQVGEGSYREE